MERPRRVVRFARLIQRRVRASRRTFGPRRLRRQSEPAVIVTQGDACGDWRRVLDVTDLREWYPAPDLVVTS
jgi:hypothetical protein